MVLLRALAGPGPHDLEWYGMITLGCDSRSRSSLTSILTTLLQTILHQSQAILELIILILQTVLKQFWDVWPAWPSIWHSRCVCSQVDILAPSAKRHPLFAEAKCQVAVLYLGQTLAAWMKCLSVIPCHLWSPGPIVTLSIFWVQSMVQNINKWEILLTHYDIDICTLTMYAIVRRLQLYTVYMHVIN